MMSLFFSRGGKDSFASSALCRTFAWFSFRVDLGLKGTGATSYPSTVLRLIFSFGFSLLEFGGTVSHC